MIGYRWNSGTKTWERVDTTKENLLAIGAVICLIIFFGLKSCYDATIGRRLKISNAEYYCSAQQLKKTGEIRCLKAKQELRKQYQKELSDKKEKLARLQNDITALEKEKQEKCSSSGLTKYGTSDCSQAENNIKNNAKNISTLTAAIQKYQKFMEVLYVPNLYYVNASALNLRSCQGTDCNILATLPAETEVFMEKDVGAWAEVDTEKGKGFVLKKYITKAATTASGNAAQNITDVPNFNIDREPDEQIISDRKTAEPQNIIPHQEAASLSPLMTAIKQNNSEEIMKLLKNNANVNDRVPCADNDSEDACMSILSLAVKYSDNPKVVKSVIDAGVALKEVYETGLTEIDVAAETAAQYNENIDVLKLLFNEGANVHLSDEGYNLLMAASSRNKNPEIIKFLIAQGIDINATDAEQNTALIYAVMYNRNPEIIKTLLDMGADVLAQDLEGHVALDYANNNPPLKASSVYTQLSDLTSEKRIQQNKK